MNQQTKDSILTALAPAPEPLDPHWSQATLAGILSPARTAAPRRPRGRRRILVGLAAGFVTLGTATAVAVGGPTDVVDNVLTQFGEQPNTSGNGLELDDPQLVAQFETERGIFALWIATGSPGEVCYALSDGQWNGEGSPTKDQLEYGCGGQIYVAPGRPTEELTRPDQFGGFFNDDDGPMVYGVSPYPGTVEVRVRAAGVDRTLPVRADSLGYGSALPEAAQVPAVTLTFLDADGHELGSKRSIAPVG